MPRRGLLEAFSSPLAGGPCDAPFLTGPFLGPVRKGAPQDPPDASLQRRV
eukprot:NODE_5903_length_667_cov_10.972492_g2187_i1.p5 GENE.NODE_5903_length_667_cov_10.972492_g2187_i1~~NODE_5903_length_667_cov_10.972492_g2187_i1.p5  ORF type:complete len:50 (+),score=0.52 NODE_5903_length_667_cov_10.972492_g2187_i1:268-417(+)